MWMFSSWIPGQGPSLQAAADNLQITVDDDGIEILKLVEGNQMGQIAKTDEVSPDGEAVIICPTPMRPRMKREMTVLPM